MSSLSGGYPLLRALFGLKQKKNENDTTAYSMDAAGLNCESPEGRRSQMKLWADGALPKESP